MANRLKSRAFHDASNAPSRVTKTTRPVGRPPKNGQAAQRIRLAPATLAAWQTALAGCLAAPRAASTKATLESLCADMAVRLAPYADAPATPADTGTAGAQPPRWRVTLADGESVTCNTLAQAAKAYGAKPASLRTMLSRGGGVCRKPAYVAGNESEVRCEKLA